MATPPYQSAKSLTIRVAAVERTGTIPHKSKCPTHGIAQIEWLVDFDLQRQPPVLLTLEFPHETMRITPK